MNEEVKQEEMQESTPAEQEHWQKNLEQFEKAKEEVQDPKIAMETYLNQPEVVQNLKSWAGSFEKIFGKRWFTIKDLIKKYSRSSQDLEQIMTFMNLKGYTISKEYGISKELHYKLTLDVNYRILIIKDLINELDVKRHHLANELEKLEKQVVVN